MDGRLQADKASMCYCTLTIVDNFQGLDLAVHAGLNQWLYHATPLGDRTP